MGKMDKNRANFCMCARFVGMHECACMYLQICRCMCTCACVPAEATAWHWVSSLAVLYHMSWGWVSMKQSLAMSFHLALWIPGLWITHEPHFICLAFKWALQIWTVILGLVQPSRHPRSICFKTEKLTRLPRWLKGHLLSSLTDCVWFLRPIKWSKRTDFCKSFSDLHMHATACAPQTYIHTISK